MAERDRIFEVDLVPGFFGGKTRADTPTIHVAGGQPGAGKSTLQRRRFAELRAQVGDEHVVQINKDAFRALHPDYADLRRKDDQTASFLTSEDAGAWTRRAVRHGIASGVHTLLESDLRNYEDIGDVLERARAGGFSSQLEFVVCHHFESRLAIATRFLGGVERWGYGRYVLRASHDEAYARQLPALASLADPIRGFDEIILYDRDSRVLLRHARGASPDAVLRTVMHHREAPRSALPVLRAAVIDLLERATAAGRQLVAADLADLRSELEAQL